VLTRGRLGGGSEANRADTVGVAAQCVQPIGWDTSWADLVRLAPAHFELENRLAEAGVVGAHAVW